MDYSPLILSLWVSTLATSIIALLGTLIAYMLARALITRPRILLLDEPFSSLDYVVTIRLRRDLKKIREIIKIPVILITHNPVEAYTMADTIIVYRQGGIEQIGTPNEIFTKPISKDVARLMGMNNIFKGKGLD
jgi:molybdate transport system ATP-binding protein